MTFSLPLPSSILKFPNIRIQERHRWLFSKAETRQEAYFVCLWTKTRRKLLNFFLGDSVRTEERQESTFVSFQTCPSCWNGSCSCYVDSVMNVVWHCLYEIKTRWKPGVFFLVAAISETEKTLGTKLIERWLMKIRGRARTHEGRKGDERLLQCKQNLAHKRATENIARFFFPACKTVDFLSPTRVRNIPVFPCKTIHFLSPTRAPLACLACPMAS